MASLLSWLGNEAKAVVAQVNPFDNGATYSTVVNHTQPAPRPAPRPAPQPTYAPPQPVYAQPQGRIGVQAAQQTYANLTSSLRAGRISPVAFGEAINQLTDAFGGVPQFKTQDITPSGKSLLAQQAINLGKGIVQAPLRESNALLHVPQALYREAQNKPITDIQKRVYGTADSGQIAKKIAGDTGQLALMAAAPAIAHGITGAVEPGLATRTAAQIGLGYGGNVAPAAATRLIAPTLTGAALGGLFNVAGTASSNPSASLKDYVKAYGQGTAAGTFLGGAGALTGEGINTIRASAPRLTNEIGAIGKDVKSGGETYYHGGTPIDKGSIAKSDLGYSVTTDKGVAKWFTNTKDGSGIAEHTISPDAKILLSKNIPQELVDNFKNLDSNKSLLENIQQGPAMIKDAERKIVAYARSKGYDAIDMRGEPFVLNGKGVLNNEAELRILNPNIIVDKTTQLKPNLNADMFSKDSIAKYEAANAADLAKQDLPKPPVSESFAKTATGKAGEPYPTNPIAPIQLPAVRNATEAIRVSESAASDLSQRVDVLAKQEDALVGKSLAGRDKFIQAVENPDQAAQIAKTFGKDSQSFLNLVQQHRDLTNMEHAAQTGAGNLRGYFGGQNGYFSHDVVLNNEADKAAYDTLLSRTIQGRTALERTNPTLSDLRANKLDIAPDTLGDATRKWGARQSTILRDAALQDRLGSIDPSIKVAQVPGENPHFISGNKEFNKQLKGVQPYSTPTVLRPLNAVNTGLKQVGLFGGGFHDLKTSIRSATTDIASLRNPVSRLVEANKQFVSDTAHTKWNQAQLDQGYGKLFADADVAKNNLGLDLRSSVGKDLTRGSIEKLNPYMNRLFSNKIDYFKKQLVIDEAKRNGITPANYDPTNPAMVKVVRDAGDQAKNWFGGLNQRTLAKSPVFQQALKYVTLAPDFTEGKVRSVANAFTGGEKGSLARRQVVSEAVGVAILAEAASKTMTGKYTNPLGAVLNPTIATNMKDKKGRPLAVGLPGSTVADINRLVTDPTHFAISHSAAGPSTLISAATGKDYFGNSLVDPFKNPNPNFGQNLVAALKSKGTIPGVQVSKTLSGQQNAATGIINTLGGRVGLDKNAQSYKDTQDFFNKQDNFAKGLNPNDKTTFNAVNPTKKDASGQPVYDPTIFQKAGTYGILRDNPAFTAKYQVYQQSQKNHDPLWDLPMNQLQEVLTLRSGKSLPAQTYTKAGASLSQATQTDQQWYKDLLAKEQTYFASLPKSTTPTTSTTDYGPQPSTYVAQQLNAKNYKDPQVQQYFNDRATYENKLRTQQGGLLPIASFGQVGVPGQLDNPGQLAITPKGSSYGTGAPKKAKVATTTIKSSKISTPKIKTVRASTRGSTKSTKSSTGGSSKALASFKVANSTKSILPKGIKIKAASYKAPKLRKISVSKIPKFSVKLRKGKQIA